MPKTNTAKQSTRAKSGSKSVKASNVRTSPAKSATGRASSAKPSAAGRGPKSPASKTSGSGASWTRSGNSVSKPRTNQTPAEHSKLREFFVDELKDIFWAEQKLVKTLPKLQKAATSQELKNAFGSHLEETKTHVQRLEKAFKLLGEKAVAKKCDAMAGITEEGSSVIEDTDAGTSTRDVALVMAGQKAEHYEIATYGGLAQIARTLGQDKVADLLEETLEEEKQADQKLTQIAENGVNYEASEEEEE